MMKQFFVLLFLSFLSVACSESMPEPEADFAGVKNRAAKAHGQLDREIGNQPELVIGASIWQKERPYWLAGTPDNASFFYAVSHIKCTESKPLLCQSGAQTKGKAELAKNLSSEIETQSKLTVQRVRGSDLSTREYEQIVKEKAKREVFEVGFVHYFDQEKQIVSSLVYMPQKDHFERSLNQLVASLATTLPADTIIGSFFVSGESRESYLSFYTGTVIQESLLNLKGVAFEHIPNDPGESKKDYLEKMKSLEQPLLWGEFTSAGDQIKLRLRFKVSGSKISKLIKSASLPFEGAVANLAQISRLERIDTKDLHKKWNKVILATVSGGRPSPFYSKESLATFRTELEERFVDAKVTVPNSGELRNLGSVKGFALKNAVKSLGKKNPKTMFLVIGLGGDVSAHSGMLYKGLARADLSLSLYKPDGQLVMKKTVSAKRFLVVDPSQMSQEKLNTESEKTVYKGMEEFGDDLVSQVIENML
ncbi:MAG: hypothetical protein QNL04_09235 [SAR324 cluster bacterium]|nr:hypothetical protein [SAR324 cluster bacterium]